jgi:hypothetical protein
MSYPTIFNFPAEGVMWATAVVVAIPVTSLKQYAGTAFGAIISIFTSIIWTEYLAYGHLGDNMKFNLQVLQAFLLLALLIASIIGAIAASLAGLRKFFPDVQSVQIRGAGVLVAVSTAVASVFLITGGYAGDVVELYEPNVVASGPQIKPFDLMPAPFGYGPTGFAGLALVFFYQVSLAWAVERLLVRAA